MEPACQPLDDGEKLERAERLAEERVGARRRGFVRRPAVRPGEEDDRDTVGRGIRLQVAAEVKAASARHAYVEHDDIGPLPAKRVDRAGRVLGFLEIDVHSLERCAKQRPQARIVVNEQDAHRPIPPNYLPVWLSTGQMA
jgi:hypothetical protein